MLFTPSEVSLDSSWPGIARFLTFLPFSLLFALLVTHEIKELEKFFKEVRLKFREVSYVPGNHDLWLMKGDKCAKHSVAKFELIMDICDRCDIRTSGFAVEGADKKDKVVIQPLLSWYHEDFDADESTRAERIRRELWLDFAYCKWPEEYINAESESPSAPQGTPEQWFLDLNLKRLCPDYEDPSATVITFSHFLPRRELYFPKEILSEYRKYYPKVIGSEKIDLQLRSLNSRVHLFGHTHAPWNQVIDSVHYVQMCLMHPKERRDKPADAFSTLEDMCIYDSDINTTEMAGVIEKKRSDRIEALSKPSSD